MMSQITEEVAAGSEAEAEAAEEKRRNRTIRFSDAEWEEVRRTALLRDASPAEFVREAVLGIAINAEHVAVGPFDSSLAPLIERMFRYTWFLATERRDAMVREGREDEIDALVCEARALQDTLRRGGVG